MRTASLHKQLCNDFELRSVLKCAAACFGATFVGAQLATPVGFVLLPVCPVAVYVVSRRLNFKLPCTIQAACLGAVAGMAISCWIWFANDPLVLLARYFFMLSLFHLSEYLFTAVSNRRSLQPDSFLLNHSVGYWCAAGLSWAEFLFEYALLPGLKSYRLSLVGVLFCLVGECIRKAAMLQAGSGFTHRLAMTKRPDHKLVTEGIYKYCRHPGYSGWLIWAVSTQIVLCNPVCAVIYAVITWQFFAQRIVDEERDLIKFFGVNYQDYQSLVWSGVPFVAGYEGPAANGPR